MTFSTINGYKPSNHFSAGLGVSYLRFNEGNLGTVNYFPLFADFRAYFGRRTALLLVGDVGYGILLDKAASRYNRTGDLYISPAIGFRTYLSDHSAWLFSIGYLSQYDCTDHSDNVSIKIGFQF